MSTLGRNYHIIGSKVSVFYLQKMHYILVDCNQPNQALFFSFFFARMIGDLWLACVCSSDFALNSQVCDDVH